LKAEEFACSNLVKIASKYKRNNPDLTSIEIAKLMKMSKSPIQKYLKKGNDLKWCTYNADKEHDKSLFKKGQKSMNSKSVVILQNNIILYNYIFESCVDLERKSEKLFGVKLGNSAISSVCRGIKPQYKGFTFKYTSDLTLEELSKLKQPLLNQVI
jgi:hypothetical protein